MTSVSNQIDSLIKSVSRETDKVIVREADYARRLAMINAILGDDHNVLGMEAGQYCRLELIRKACFHDASFDNPVQALSAEYLTADDEADLAKIDRTLTPRRRRRVAKAEG